MSAAKRKGCGHLTPKRKPRSDEKPESPREELEKRGTNDGKSRTEHEKHRSKSCDEFKFTVPEVPEFRSGIQSHRSRQQSGNQSKSSTPRKESKSEERHKPASISSGVTQAGSSSQSLPLTAHWKKGFLKAFSEMKMSNQKESKGDENPKNPKSLHEGDDKHKIIKMMLSPDYPSKGESGDSNRLSIRHHSAYVPYYVIDTQPSHSRADNELQNIPLPIPLPNKRKSGDNLSASTPSKAPKSEEQFKRPYDKYSMHSSSSSGALRLSPHKSKKPKVTKSKSVGHLREVTSRPLDDRKSRKSRSQHLTDDDSENDEY